MALQDPKRLLPARKRLPHPPRTSSAPPASQQRQKKETLLLPKILSSSASSAERSMLSSMLRAAKETEIKPIVGLRKHEYQDDSEDEERSERRARSASYGSNVFRNRPRRETPPLRFVREKTGDGAAKEKKEPPTRKLVFDSEFGCYYDPLTDRYYTVENP